MKKNTTYKHFKTHKIRVAPDLVTYLQGAFVYIFRGCRGSREKEIIVLFLSAFESFRRVRREFRPKNQAASRRGAGVHFQRGMSLR